jgi:hypothetical protein
VGIAEVHTRLDRLSVITDQIGVGTHPTNLNALLANAIGELVGCITELATEVADIQRRLDAIVDVIEDNR